jgi:hypothetical protein
MEMSDAERGKMNCMKSDGELHSGWGFSVFNTLYGKTS